MNVQAPLFNSDKLLEILSLSQNATAVYTGSDITIQTANNAMLKIWGRDKSVIGKPLAQAIPELAGQPFLAILKQVWETGNTYEAKDTPAELVVDGKLQTFYFDFIYRAIANETGSVDCILHTATDVTDLHLNRHIIANAARQQDALDKEQALNEEMAAANQQLSNVNDELKRSHETFEQLNFELEQRVANRTQALSVSETKFRSLIEDSPIAMQVFKGDNMTFEIVNESMLRFLGKTADIIGKTLFEGVPEIVGQPIVELLYGVYKNGESLELKAIPVTLHRNGRDENGYYDVSYRPLYDDGNITGVLGIAIDVTAQITALQGIRESEERFRTMAESSGILIAVGDDTSNATYFSKAWVDLTGRSMDDLLAFGWVDLVHPDDRERYVNIYLDAFKIKGPFTGEFRILNKEGEYRTLLATGQPRFNEDNLFAGYISSSMDITGLIIIKQQLLESEGRLQLLADNISQLTWMTDENGYIFWYNKRWYDYTGTTFEEMKGWGWDKVHHPEHIERVTKKWKSILKSGNIWEDTFPIRSESGEYRWFLSRAVPLTDETGKIIRWFGTNTDVTEQKQDDQRKNDFIGMVSHELKTPLTSLSAYLQILQLKTKSSDDTFVIGALDKANKQIRKMTAMINGFLNVSRLESGKIHIDKRRFNMADLVKEVEEESVATITSHHLVFAPVQETFVVADQDKIGQVINNFISNAVKYADVGTTIHVACVTINNMAQVSVSDQGMGIDQKDLPHLFDRYYRVENNSTISGFGIGLYLCAEIVNRHNGQIWVDSETGKGSTFYFTLPLSE